MVHLLLCACTSNDWNLSTLFIFSYLYNMSSINGLFMLLSGILDFKKWHCTCMLYFVSVGKSCMVIKHEQEDYSFIKAETSLCGCLTASQFCFQLLQLMFYLKLDHTYTTSPLSEHIV